MEWIFFAGGIIVGALLAPLLGARPENKEAEEKPRR